ncbi:MAG: sulfatase-like hydrolase/transferase, partial [Thermodesulfobacteriota bacterium]
MKNVLFLLSDEHSQRFLGCTGANSENAITPNIDQLSAGGVRFTDAYCQMPLCTPSRISLLTGKQVRKSGAWTNESIIRPELDTLPRSFAGAGYASCLVGKMHLGGTQQFAGFQFRPYGDLTGKCGHQWEPITDLKRARSMRIRTELSGKTGIPESQLQDSIVTRETIAWIREHRAAQPDQPFFLTAGFSRPHFPLTAPGRWVEYYKKRGIPRPFAPAAGDAFDHPMSTAMRKGFQAEAISDEEMMSARIGYFANVSYLDEVIGDLLSTLNRDGALENTIIIYTSDHGEL